jgi:hypothetical protein
MRDTEYMGALQRYSRLRCLAYETVERWVLLGRAGAPVALTEIDSVAIEAWYSTWQRRNPLGYGGWDWPALVAPVRRRPAAFHLAIWSGEWLCGLAVGRASKRRRSGVRHTLSVHFLEGNSDPRQPLRGRVAPLALAGAEAYAAILGTRRLRLMDPLPGVHRIYTRLGFGIVPNSRPRLYFEKRVDIHETLRF